MIKHNEIVVDKDRPFLNCKLGREKYAGILTDIVMNYRDGFVLAINSEWGTGKTTFVKMWQQQLQNEKFRTLYFNAWESDFEENPLIAFIAEFRNLVGENINEKYKYVVKNAGVFLKNIGPAIIKAAVESNPFTKGAADIAENIAKAAAEVMETELKEYKKKKDGISNFKKALKDFVDSVDEGKPIVFIVDELDRCRPNYAVLLLEQIKHLYSVPNIVFVLAIDKEQLGHAVRGVYGSEQLNADEYLRRFIDLEYSIPRPEAKNYLTYLYKYFGFENKLFGEKRKNVREFWNDYDDFIAIAEILFEKRKLSLRQQERIFAHARIALRSLRWNQYLYPILFIYLIYLKQFYFEIYTSIKVKTYSISELLEKLKIIIPAGIDDKDIRHVVHLEALLVFAYSNYKHERIWLIKQIEEEDHTDSISVKIKSQFDNSENQKEFARIIQRCMRSDSPEFSIKHLLDKIDLLEQVEI